MQAGMGVLMEEVPDCPSGQSQVSIYQQMGLCAWRTPGGPEEGTVQGREGTYVPTGPKRAGVGVEPGQLKPLQTSALARPWAAPAHP